MMMGTICGFKRPCGQGTEFEAVLCRASSSRGRHSDEEARFYVMLSRAKRCSRLSAPKRKNGVGSGIAPVLKYLSAVEPMQSESVPNSQLSRDEPPTVRFPLARPRLWRGKPVARPARSGVAPYHPQGNLLLPPRHFNFFYFAPVDNPFRAMIELFLPSRSFSARGWR